LESSTYRNIFKAANFTRQKPPRTPSLRANATFMNLVGRMEPHAPVFRIAPGSEIGQWIGDSVPPAMSSRIVAPQRALA
jgi:hypothetical protein